LNGTFEPIVSGSTKELVSRAICTTQQFRNSSKKIVDENFSTILYNKANRARNRKVATKEKEGSEFLIQLPVT
jgi:hypothetical protein